MSEGRQPGSRFAVWGDPVEHSLSPRMHRAAFAALGLRHRYERRRVSPGDLAQALAEARVDGHAGLNLTVPHKRIAAGLVDRLTPRAARVGAINAIKIGGGALLGDNTDGPGFLDALDRLPGGAVEHAVVLGAGGASLAVVDALLVDRGVGRLSWITRRPAALDHRLAGDPRVRVHDYAWLASVGSRRAADERAQLLVDTTTVGMAGGPTQFPAEFDLGFLDAGSRVVDLVYPASSTGLSRRAEALGFAASDGLPMLLWQGLRSLEFWLDRRLDGKIVESMAAALAAGATDPP